MRSLKKGVRWAIILVLALGLALSWGCIEEGSDEQDNEKEFGACPVDLYFINAEYAKTGDEELEHYFIESREFDFELHENPWVAVLEGLKSVNSDSAETAIATSVDFVDVYISDENDDVMIVNLKNIESGGSMQESFFIGQIVKTIVENEHLFKGGKSVKGVQFLVDGEKTESLMGHFDASEPFSAGED